MVSLQTNMKRDRSKNNSTRAWLLLVTALLLHAIDEAVTDFLGFYNPLVLDLRHSLGFFPMPTFSFAAWITLLAVAITTGYAVTPLVRRGGRFMWLVMTVASVVMLLNALGHTIGSIYFARILPGFWSSPILFASAVYALTCVGKSDTALRTPARLPE